MSQAAALGLYVLALGLARVVDGAAAIATDVAAFARNRRRRLELRADGELAPRARLIYGDTHNPRIDAVIQRFTPDGRLETRVLAGTPTAGAELHNLAGAPPRIPDGWTLRAHVPIAAATVRLVVDDLT